MRAAVPSGDLAALIEDAITEKIARLETRRLGAAREPRKSAAQSDSGPGPRHVAAAVKRAVRERDQDRCAYVDEQGRRCTERNWLQFHHRVPHGVGGDRSVRNIAQLCWRHNQLEAETDFGKANVQRRPGRGRDGARTGAGTAEAAATGTASLVNARRSQSFFSTTAR